MKGFEARIVIMPDQGDHVIGLLMLPGESFDLAWRATFPTVPSPPKPEDEERWIIPGDEFDKVARWLQDTLGAVEPIALALIRFSIAHLIGMLYEEWVMNASS